jgi:hypothetical protein
LQDCVYECLRALEGEKATVETVKQKRLIHYGIEAGVAVTEIYDPPANTNTNEIMQQLGAAGALKRVTLELGGKSPDIVLADRDLKGVVRGATTGIFYGTEEVCAAGSRLFVEKDIQGDFMQKLVDRT